MNARKTTSGLTGHRQRLKDRFLAGDNSTQTEEALLELLLSYAIPQKDVLPVARALLARFGSLERVLAADVGALCQVDGIKIHTAVLIKLAERLRTLAGPDGKDVTAFGVREAQQPTLPEFSDIAMAQPPTGSKRKAAGQKKTIQRQRTGLFGKAILKEAIEMLPRLPDTDSLDEIRDYLKKNLRFSAAETRERNASYIVRRMFPAGYADPALRAFAKPFGGKQELRDVCFYRFCHAEPLMMDVMNYVLLPAIGRGVVKRDEVRDYLVHRFGALKSIPDTMWAIADALGDAGLAKVSRTLFTFAYREPLVPSFTFVLHSEFPEPGMYDIAKLESNPALKAMLWNPDRLLPLLYELRNRGLIAKISEIDSVRQFTIRYSLDKVVETLVSPVEASG